MWDHIFSVTERCGRLRQNSSGFCSFPVVGSVAGRLQAAENRRRQRYKQAHKLRPTETWARNVGVFPEAPLYCSENQTWLEEHILFPSKGEQVRAERTKRYRQGSRTMQLELMGVTGKSSLFLLGGNKQRHDPLSDDSRYIRGLDKTPWGYH